jgi:hypothetical protein|tara:strand:- start:126 stop:1502 length:1377 start_codon:yes stop_codon:yes gene_type:complete
LADDTKTIYQVKLQISKLNESIRDQEEEIKDLKGKALKDAKEKLAEDKKDLSILRQTANLEKEMLDLSNEISMLEEDISFYRQKQADFAGDIGKNIQEQVESIPLIGASLSKNLQLDELSEALKAKQLLATTDIKMTDEERAALQEKINLLTKANPIMFIVGALALLVAYLKQTVSLSQELNTSFMQTAALQPSINAASLMLVGTGQDASKIAGEMLDAFGSVDNITASAIRRVGHLSTKLGASTENIIKVQKSLSDLFNLSADASQTVIQNIGALAASQGVAAGKVIEDLATNSSKFAEFATDGAMGFAQAAIEARKVGANLSAILGVADNLLDFETSLTKQFEAQVLTGKNLNLERARQLSLEGDIAGLTQEIQRTVGSLGEIQSMNVIERRAIAEAIGLSADDLLKVARGEAVAEQETVQDKLDTTNQLLAAQQGEREAILQATKQNNIGAGLVY